MFVSDPQPFHKFRISRTVGAQAPTVQQAVPALRPAAVPPAPDGTRLEYGLPPAAWPAPDDACWELIRASRDELVELYHSISGRLEFIGLHSYPEARSAIDLSFPVPRVIAFCANRNDVRTCLNWARQREWPFSVRSGGHNGAGYHLSNGLVIDLQNLDDIHDQGGRATAEAGVRWGAFGAALDATGHYVPGGTCPTVSVSGYTMGGGYSVASRTVGLACDLVESIQVMTADGEVVAASRGENQDLFWAMTGGGGGQFGVLLEITFRTLGENQFVGFVLNWPLSEAPNVLKLLENQYTGDANPELGYLMALTTLVKDQGSAGLDPPPPESRSSLSMLGLFRGSVKALETAVAPLLRAGPSGSWRWRSEGTYHKMNADIFKVLPYKALGLGQATKLEVTGYVDRSKSLDWEALTEQIARSENPGNLIAFEPYGGAIARLNDASSFPHRDQKLNLKINSYYRADWVYNTTRASAQIWLDRTREIADRALNGRVYVNYMREGIGDYRSAYYAQNLEALIEAKRRYDPLNFFRSPQPLAR